MLACVIPQADAAQCGNSAAGYEGWKQQFAGEARAKGVSANTISALMATNYAQATINADRGQRSFSALARTVSRQARRGDHRRQGTAVEAFARRAVCLDPAALRRAAGAAARDLGHGDRLWRQRGNQNMLASIATLAYDCRRSEYFTEHLYAALQLIDRGALSPSPARLHAWRSRPDPVHAQGDSGLRHRQSRKLRQRAELDRRTSCAPMAGRPAPATSPASRTSPPSRPGTPPASIKRPSR